MTGSDWAWLALAGLSFAGGLGLSFFLWGRGSRQMLPAKEDSHSSSPRLGNYFLHRILGEGGMGKIYVASHTMLCRPAAVKVIQAGGPDPEAMVRRFEREVLLASTLTHPNTITVYDFGRSEADTFFYAMEYLEGSDLQRMVEKFGPLPAARAVYILRQICGSLAEAHGKNIVHRDIKPSNIFLTHRGNIFDFVKVLDFGLAKHLQEGGDSFLTPARSFFGTPLYFAPEAMHGMAAVDARSDIYNLGGLAYWMLTGHPPFDPASKVQLIIEHISKPPLPPSQITELPIPGALESIVLKCLEKDPQSRFQSISSLEEALNQVPLEAPWTPAQAELWWKVHRPDGLPSSSAPTLTDPGNDKGPRQG